MKELLREYLPLRNADDPAQVLEDLPSAMALNGEMWAIVAEAARSRRQAARISSSAAVVLQGASESNTVGFQKFMFYMFFQTLGDLNFQRAC